MESLTVMQKPPRKKLTIVPPPIYAEQVALILDAERAHAIGPHGKRARLTPPQAAFLEAFGTKPLWSHYDMAMRLYPEDAAWPADYYRAVARVYRQVRDILHSIGWRVETVLVVRSGIGWEFDSDEAKRQAGL